MFICPQCQSENSDERQFCSVCGTSLTDLVSTEIPSKALAPFNSNAFTDLNSRTALIYCPKEATKIWQTREYVDIHSRYRIDSIDAGNDGNLTQFIAIAVTDTTPSDKSFLRKLLAENKIVALEDFATIESVNNIPQIALPYLKLARFEPNLSSIDAAIPEIYDAWLENDTEDPHHRKSFFIPTIIGSPE